MTPQVTVNGPPQINYGAPVVTVRYNPDNTSKEALTGDVLSSIELEAIRKCPDSAFLRQAILSYHGFNLPPVPCSSEQLEAWLTSVPVKAPFCSPADAPVQRINDRNPTNEATISVSVTRSEDRSYNTWYSTHASGEAVVEIPLSVAARGPNAINEWANNHDVWSDIDMEEDDGDYGDLDDCDYNNEESEWGRSLIEIAEEARERLSNRENE